MIIGWFFAGGILLLGSIFDVKRLCIPLWLVILGVAGGVAGTIYLGVMGQYSWWELLLGMLPGALSIALAFLTKEQIGYGDGLILYMLGGCIGGPDTLAIWFGGLVISFIVSVLLLVTKKADRSTRIPFIPCLFLGYVFICIGGVAGVL